MKNFKTLMLLMALAIINTAWANPVGENRARSIAANFMASKSLSTANLKMVHKALRPNATTTTDGAAYYVFNANNGFVIVAGDDRAPAVLGYSDNGTFDNQNIPEAMQELLKGYAAQMGALDQGGKPRAQFTAGGAIRPLVSASWSQNPPYNTLLPLIAANKHAYVGCVATAMAQVMYYHKWPKTTTCAVPEYTSTTKSIFMPELPVTDFDWNLMQDTYMTTDTASAEALAAAKLVLYCAQSVKMNFMNNSSGAPTPFIPLTLSTYFGYKGSMHTLKRINYTSQEWEDIIYTELAAKRPVIYSGSKVNSGHAFICDGYDGYGLFHINWGWNGNSDGYYLLNVLNPDIQGTGSATGAYGYIYNQGIIVGIEPGEEANVFEVTADNVTLNNYIETRTENSSAFWAEVSGQFYNLTSQFIALNYGWGLYQDEEQISLLTNYYYDSLEPGHYMNLENKKLYFGDNITSGTYKILPIYSERGAGNWRPCIGADKNYIEVTIDGNTCSYKCYGSVADPDYTVNDISVTGNMHPGRPVNVTLNMTNNGDSRNQLLYMHVNGTFTSTGYVSIEKGETSDIPIQFVPTSTGDLTLSFSFNENGSSPIATRTITINEMPAANLTATAQVLNVTDANNSIITSEKFSVLLTITNNGSTTYSEDISMKMYKLTQGNSGSAVQAKDQFLELAPGATTTIQFDLDNVIDGWKYFAWAYYYSSGQQVSFCGIPTHTIVFPETPDFIAGDVNNDGLVDVTDITVAISYILGNAGEDSLNVQAADFDGNGQVDVTDITLIIAHVLGNS